MKNGGLILTYQMLKNLMVKRNIKFLIFLPLLFVNGCECRGMQRDPRLPPGPNINEFKNSSDCESDEWNFKYCKELVSIPIGEEGTLLEIPRNYLNQWYLYPESSSKNYALVFSSWPGLGGMSADRRGFSRGEEIKIVFRGVQEPGISTSANLASEVDSNKHPVVYLPDLQLNRYKSSGYFYSDRLKSYMGDEPATLICHTYCFDSGDEGASCTCQSMFLVDHGSVYARYEYNMILMDDWMNIHLQVNQLIRKFLGDEE